MSLNAQSSILDILKSGGTVTLPSGYQFVGDPGTGYIQLRIAASHSDLASDLDDGICHLSEKGLEEAFGYASLYERERTSESSI